MENGIVGLQVVNSTNDARCRNPPRYIFPRS
jgi:hypothetical protein